MRRHLIRGAGNSKVFRYALFLAVAIIFVFAFGIYLLWSSSSSSSASKSKRPTHGHTSFLSVPPISSSLSRNKQQQQQQQPEINNEAAGETSDAGYGKPSAAGRLCALVVDARPITPHRAPTAAEDEQLRDVVNAAAEAFTEFEANKDAAARHTVFVFSPFIDQPPVPSDIFATPSASASSAASQIPRRQLNLNSADRHRVSNMTRSGPSWTAEDEAELNSKAGKKTPGAASTSSTTFIQGVLRVMVAIEKLARTADSDGGGEDCTGGVFLIHAVFSARPAVVDSVRGAIRAMVLHPTAAAPLSTNEQQEQLQNQQQRQIYNYILSPLILSTNSKKEARDNEEHKNIYSFGNDVVELYEGMAWPVPRFYGMPKEFAPAQRDSAVNAPSGVLSFITPRALAQIPGILARQMNNPRNRAGRAWLERARRGFAVDIAVSAHHIFEVHLLACDAAMAEIAGSGAAGGFGVLALAVRGAGSATVPPLLFEEEAISARYMMAVAHAATGLGSVHLHDNKNITKAMLAAGYGGSSDPFSRAAADSMHMANLNPAKLVRAPAPWAVRVLPHLTTVASDAWFTFFARTALPNVTLFWDPYCSCTGINVEAINFLVALEKFVRTRAVANRDCWCKGFPAVDQFALRRMSGPKLLAGGSTSRFHVWVSHKPVDAFPSFPYDGAVQYGIYPPSKDPQQQQQQQQQHRHLRPDYVIGRTMIESDRIPADWVARLNDRSSPTAVDELWVPSRFLVDAFRKSGVRHSLPITVIPEAIDANFYDPVATTKPHPQIDRDLIGCDTDKRPDECVVFLSNFKWERRKGWDILLRAYFSTFRKSDNVVLVLKTYLYMTNDPYNVEKIKNKVFSFARDHMPELDMKELPRIWIIAEETAAYMMPRLYRGADVCVLPTRGEGWGLPLHEAKTMGLVTIGTRWGGSLDFMPASSDGRAHFLVNITGLETADGRGVPDEEAAKPGRREPLFASPSVPHLAEIMKHVAKKMSKRHRDHMGAGARWEAASYFGRAPVAERVLRRLAAIYREQHQKRSVVRAAAGGPIPPFPGGAGGGEKKNEEPHEQIGGGDAAEENVKSP